MRTVQIETLIHLTPMKMLTENMKQVTQAIVDSYDSGDTDQIPELAESGKQLLDAIAKLSKS